MKTQPHYPSATEWTDRWFAPGDRLPLSGTEFARTLGSLMRHVAKVYKLEDDVYIRDQMGLDRSFHVFPPKWELLDRGLILYFQQWLLQHRNWRIFIDTGSRAIHSIAVYATVVRACKAGDRDLEAWLRKCRLRMKRQFEEDQKKDSVIFQAPKKMTKAYREYCEKMGDDPEAMLKFDQQLEESLRKKALETKRLREI